MPSPRDETAEPDLALSVRISRQMSATWKEFYGRGPSHVATYAMPDVVFVVMRGGYNRVEQTLKAAGRGDDVDRQRAVFQSVMERRFVELIEHETGRPVEAFLSANHQDPDVMVETFLLRGHADRSSQDEAG